MGAAALRGRAGQVRGDGLDPAGVRVGGHQAHLAQASGEEVGEELVPCRPGLGGRDAHAEDLAVPVTVDAGGDEHDSVDDPAGFADLPRQGVRGDERERSRLVEGPVAEGTDVLVEVGGHPAHLGLGQRVDSEGLDELVDPAGGHARDSGGMDAPVLR